VLAAVSVSAADDTDPAAELKRIETALEDEKASGAALERLTAALAAEVERLRGAMAAAATRAQRTETDMLNTEETLIALRAEAGALRAGLAGRRGDLAQLAGALQRLARNPPETLLLIGRAPLDTVHTGVLLESAIPRLNAEATALRRELDTLATLEADIRAQRDRLEIAAGELDAERAQLAALADEKVELLSGTQARATDTAREIRALSESARSLRELLQRLEQREAAEAEEQRRLAALVSPDGPPAEPTQDRGEPPSPVQRPDARPSAGSAIAALPPLPSMGGAKGRLFTPVAGRVVQRFGGGGPADLTNQGLLLRTRPGALVIAPHDGAVLYGGPFEGFGQILIIEHGDGYHTLLAGLDRIDLGVGARVLAGEPVGAMANAPQAGPGEGPELYVELRHNGDPIDPLPWFAGLSAKAKG
jgi:septal ring factor EnvC (AmiA/AmiB activator)